ncbi:hypothetical protein B0H66DRAFT_558199 [Apodospora peruviana]|uniref:Uncharacterized protein n=1 Tax=Apodospora peruviana TaxID=516989 RepID=A0AAE0I5Q0_9PEZI|nr:hypothetical protein B0H66DRAFT_558199 [Apodospora peruviana]
MAPDKSQRYDPVPPIPSYDEAIAGGSSHWQQPHSPIPDHETEAQSLLNTRHPFQHSNNAHNGRGRRPRGYRQPTVETDDDEDSWGSTDSDSDTDEADHVRREMQELEIEDPNDQSRNLSSWGKRIGFSLSLPQWPRWRWRLPQSPFSRNSSGGANQSGGGAGGGATNNDNDANADDSPGRRFAFPTLGSTALFILVGRMLAIFLVLGFVYLLFMSDIFTNMARRMGSQTIDPERLRDYVQSAIDPGRIRETVKHFTSYAHLAGTEGDYFLAEDTVRLFRSYGLEEVTMDEYQVYLNYPKAGGRAVEIMGEDGKPPIWSAKLEEMEHLAFHGHSKAGDVKGPLIYANYGSREDFEKLHEIGIDTKGAIALVRYHASQGDLASKVKAAELAGFSGCIIYSDQIDDGTRGYTAPDGQYIPADGVQNGTVSLMSWVVGDVLTPGWASKPNMPRETIQQTQGLVKIPSLPLAWRDAQVLLRHLKGFGQQVQDGWKGGVPDVAEWWTGNLSSPVVRLKNEQDENEKQPIWNVYGKIKGIEQMEKSIIIGNHRDAWSFGAADPHSGTAVMMEVARIFGELVARTNWRPLRTIEFMSWDAGEFNLIGSTEYVEQNDDNLKLNALAYINLDTTVTGGELHAAGSPVFRRLLLQVMNRVSDPNFNTTLRDLWDRRHGDLEGLGAGSDYVAFQDIVGTSSLDLHFDGGGEFPYHSRYDTFDWMDSVGDPGFVYHRLLAVVVGLITLDLADRPILPFDMAAYADKLPRWVDELIEWAKREGADKHVSFGPLTEAVAQVGAAIRRFSHWEQKWENSIMATDGYEPIVLGNTRCDYNSKMGLFETDLLDDAGTPNRTQFKHVIFGPQLWSSNDVAYFPSIRDTIASGDWVLADETIRKVADVIRTAADNLVPHG